MTYYISPRFLNKLAIHITKNFLKLPNVKVPLILGVHGRKGEGKSFQCELVFEQMGINVVHMSAGELESPDAGDPARTIRMRYREAADLVKVRGKMAVLMINDIDAGAGRVDQYTQYTVNTQLVNGTLMNIADNPTNVQLPGSYDSEPVQRIPIIVTGNDFATLYAPLIRDGRMEKFFWEPSRDDRIGIVSGIFDADEIDRSNVEKLVDTFPEQSIDFYGAVRSRLYDEQVQRLIESVGIDRISLRVVNSAEAPPEFRKPDFSLPHLLEVGHEMVGEQRRIQEMRLAEEYNKSLYFTRKVEAIAQQPAAPIAPNGHKDQSQSYAGQPASTRLTPEMVTEVNRVLGMGDPSGSGEAVRLGIEWVDKRRFQSNSWNCYSILEGNGAEAIAALEACLEEHDKDYVRLVSISAGDRRRISENIIHRP
jgi:ribulose bisphosphate carboxylase small subunit